MPCILKEKQSALTNHQISWNNGIYVLLMILAAAYIGKQNILKSKQYLLSDALKKLTYYRLQISLISTHLKKLPKPNKENIRTGFLIKLIRYCLVPIV